MRAGDNWEGDSFAKVLSGCLSLGLFFGWATFGNAEHDLVFGALVSGGSPHKVALRVATGIAFFALSLGLVPPRHMLSRRCAWMSVALAIVSVAVRWCSVPFGSWLLIPGAVLAGFALALFLCAWLSRYRSDMGSLLIMLLFATSIGNFAYSGAYNLGTQVSRFAALSFPIFAALVFYAVPMSFGSGGEASDGQAGRSRLSFGLQMASLLLCNFASGPVSYGATSGLGAEAGIGPIVAFVLATLLTLYGRPRSETLFALFAFGTCLCIALALVVEVDPSWLVSLRSAGFWAIMMYSIAWFAVEGRTGKTDALSPMSLRGIAAIYILSGLAEIIGTMFPGDTAGVMALVMVGLALALALVDATHAIGSDASRRSMSASAVPVAPALTDVLRTLSDRAGLTEGERRVFECLSRGYSLKQVAQQLGTTEGAAKFHRHNVYQKLGISSREELIELVEQSARER